MAARENPITPPADVCAECDGRGWKIVPDGGAGTAVECECTKKQRGHLYLATAGIPERYQRCRLSNFKTSIGDPKISSKLLGAQKVCRLYVDEFFDAKTKSYKESGLVFIGPPGIGKTHLAAAVLSEVVERYHLKGRFIDFTTLVHQIQSTFDPKSPQSAHTILNPIIEAQILVLDELGAQKPTEWVMNTLYLIMNTRYTERRPTIFTTNYHLDNNSKRRGANHLAPDSPQFELLSTRISPLLVSRLYEMAQPVNLGDLDYRREVKMHQHRIGR